MGLALLLPLVGCGVGDDGDGSADFEGCGSDVDCKGDRICEQGMCVNPDEAGNAGSGSVSDADTGSGSSSGVDAGSGSDTDTGSGSGSSSGSDVVDDPALEAACIADCEAKHQASCEMNIGSLDQCMGQCLVVDEINDGYCLSERRAQYECLAAGGYTCVNGYPQPQSTCIAENQALATCNQESPCRRFCDEVEGMSCAPDGDCFESCRTQEQGFDNQVCSFDYSRLLSCWSADLSCDGDRPAVNGCGAQVAGVADCIGLRTGECEGYCWAAETLGCGSDDCVETCTPKLEDAACGYLYRRLLDCTYDDYDDIDLECVDGEPTPGADCESEVTEYAACADDSAP
jgi:hypothetical protein